MIAFQTAKDVQQQLFESIEHLISYYEVKRDQLPLPLTLAVSEEIASLESDQSSHDTGLSLDVFKKRWVFQMSLCHKVLAL